MKTKTLAELVAEVKAAAQNWPAIGSGSDRRRLDGATGALEAAIANPPAGSELDRLRMREPRREEMEAALGEANEAFYEGWTIRRCRHCRIPVAGGPTACEVCAATQDPDKNPWPPPKVAGAVGRMKSLIAAVEAERAGERVVEISHGKDGTGLEVTHITASDGGNLTTDDIGCILDTIFGTCDAGHYIIRRRPDPPKPTAKRPWRLKTGRMICAECQQDVPPKWLMCDNGDCPQYGNPWGKPRDLPSGEEVGG